MSEEKVFLGVVQQDLSIYIPWRGTHVGWSHPHEAGQNVLVTLKNFNDFGRAQVVKLELPTLVQLQTMKLELQTDWMRFSEIFRNATMEQKVKMLRALDGAMQGSLIKERKSPCQWMVRRRYNGWETE